jgi:hypothetical protein
MNRIRRQLTYSNVMATIAVFLVLGGGAYAASKIGAGDIRRNAVRSKHIKDGQVKTRDLATSIPAARVTRTAGQSIPNNALTPLAFNSERYDTAAMHGNETNNSRLTAPVRGIYTVTLEISWLFNATGLRTIDLAKNGTAEIAVDTTSPPAAGDQEITTQVRLRAGDFVVARAEQDSGGALSISKSSVQQYSPEFSMTWLAPGP